MIRPSEEVRAAFVEPRTVLAEDAAGGETSFHADEPEDESRARKYDTELLRASFHAVSNLFVSTKELGVDLVTYLTPSSRFSTRIMPQIHEGIRAK